MRRTWLLTWLLPAVIGCSSSTAAVGPAASSAVTPASPTIGSPPTPASVGTAFLWIGPPEADGLAAVELATGRVLARLPVGVPDASWSTLYATQQTAGTTLVQAIDTASGAVVRSTELAGSWTVPAVVPGDLPGGLTSDGRLLVLENSSPGPGASSFALADPSFATRPAIVNIRGSFSFDAVGGDGRYLFLIEHIGLTGSGHYQVRAYDTRAGALLPGVIVDKREVGEEMEGRPLARAQSADGKWVYTLYLRDDGSAFVHELDTLDAIAWCVDLPPKTRSVTSADSDAWRIAVGPTGLAVVANGRSRFLARLDEAQLGQQLRLASSGSVNLAVGDSGRVYLLGSDGLTLLDAAFQLLAHVATPKTGSIALLPDGEHLVVATGGRLEQLTVRDDAVVPGQAVTLEPDLADPAVRLIGVTGGS